jgi:hypothetical protein
VQAAASGATARVTCQTTCEREIATIGSVGAPLSPAERGDVGVTRWLSGEAGEGGGGVACLCVRNACPAASCAPVAGVMDADVQRRRQQVLTQERRGGGVDGRPGIDNTPGVDSRPRILGFTGTGSSSHAAALMRALSRAENARHARCPPQAASFHRPPRRAKKLASIALPPSVRMDSGWNCERGGTGWCAVAAPGDCACPQCASPAPPPP